MAEPAKAAPTEAAKDLKSLAAPTVGRIVHFYQASALGDEGPSPALVLAVDDDGRPTLQIFKVGSLPLQAIGVPYVRPEQTHSHLAWWEWPPKA